MLDDAHGAWINDSYWLVMPYKLLDPGVRLRHLGERTTSEGETADVLGARAWADWVLPMNNDIRLRGQFETVIRDLGTSSSDDTALIFEIGYSLTTSITLVLDYRAELNSSMGNENDAFYFSFIYYGF